LSSPGPHVNVFVPVHDGSEVLQMPDLGASYAIGSYRLPGTPTLTNQPKVPDRKRFPSPKKWFLGERLLVPVSQPVRNGDPLSSGRSAMRIVCLKTDLFRPLGWIGSDREDGSGREEPSEGGGSSTVMLRCDLCRRTFSRLLGSGQSRRLAGSFPGWQ